MLGTNKMLGNPVLIAAFAFAASMLEVDAQYLAYDLGPGSANHINSSGAVVGYTTRNGTQLAFRYSGGLMTTLDRLPGADISLAYSINDLGDISGSSGGNSTPGYLRGFLYHSGVMTAIGTLGSQTYAGAINNSGTIVGESTLPTGLTHAFSYSQGVMTDLGTLGGRFSRARSINSAGVIVGDADLSHFTHAFRYSDGIMIDLGSLDDRMSFANDINDSGTIVGYSTVGGASSGYEHAFRYDDGVMIDLGTLVVGSAGSSEATAINSQEVIVGGSDAWGGTDWTRHAFIYENGVMTDLAPYLTTLGLGGLSFAQDINDKGDIVGFALDAAGNGHGFLLQIPEPSSPALLALGILAWAVRRIAKPERG
jgi:probable HAF family extracellular repeat protein